MLFVHDIISPRNAPQRHLGDVGQADGPHAEAGPPIHAVHPHRAHNRPHRGVYIPMSSISCCRCMHPYRIAHEHICIHTCIHRRDSCISPGGVPSRTAVRQWTRTTTGVSTRCGAQRGSANASPATSSVCTFTVEAYHTLPPVRMFDVCTHRRLSIYGP